MMQMQSILEYKVRKLANLKNEILTLGTELGWLDADGTYAPLERELLGTATELDLRRLNSKSDFKKGLIYARMIRERDVLENEINDFHKIQ